MIGEYSVYDIPLANFQDFHHTKKVQKILDGPSK